MESVYFHYLTMQNKIRFLRLTAANIFFLLGALLCAQGIFVLVKLIGSISITERGLLIGVSLLIFGLYFFQVSDKQHLRERIETLEKRLQKSEPNL
jgi:hypothetical protein